MIRTKTGYPVGLILWILAFINLPEAGWSQSRSQSSDAAPNQASQSKTTAPLGTIKSISGNTLILTNDDGGDVNIELQDSTKILRVAPGQKDLKGAVPIPFSDLQVGDRIMTRGRPSEDGKRFLAGSVISMKKAEIADKQAREREEWQKSGVGGLVTTVDAAGGVINISVTALREKKSVAVRISQQTVLRRYAPGSVKFDEARMAPLGEIKPGDQVRARGAKNADGSEISAAEVVSGSFRNISGTVSSLDRTLSTIIVHDLLTKKQITVTISRDSQLRRLPVEMAQRIARRVSGPAGTDSADPSPDSLRAAAPTAKDPVVAETRSAGADIKSTDRRNDARPGQGFGGPRGSGGNADLQQIINRMPAATISDLNVGDAVMLVATVGSGNNVTAITLVAGVEPILQGAPNSSASTILSPWSLNNAPSGE